MDPIINTSTKKNKEKDDENRPRDCPAFVSERTQKPEVGDMPKLPKSSFSSSFSAHSITTRCYTGGFVIRCIWLCLDSLMTAVSSSQRRDGNLTIRSGYEPKDH